MYCDFNSNLVKTRFMHEESLGMCDYETTQILQFFETGFYHYCMSRKFSFNP